MRVTQVKLALLPLLLSPLLAACDPREPVSVATDPRIVRGDWSGAVPFDPAQATPIALNLTARYVNESAYRLDGVMTLGQTSETVTGGMSGGSIYRYEQGTLQAAAAPPVMVLGSTDAVATWSIDCYLSGTVNTLACLYFKEHSSTQPPTSFTLTRGTP